MTFWKNDFFKKIKTELISWQKTFNLPHFFKKRRKIGPSTKPSFEKLRKPLKCAILLKGFSYLIPLWHPWGKNFQKKKTLSEKSAVNYYNFWGEFAYFFKKTEKNWSFHFLSIVCLWKAFFAIMRNVDKISWSAAGRLKKFFWKNFFSTNFP